jgi:hypothetical protein
MKQLLSFKKGLFEYYQVHVQGNGQITYDQAARKMTRNLQLAEKVDSTGHRGQLYKYGSLHFIVDKENRIVWIKNYCRIPDGWALNKKEYLRLNKQLGIEDDSTMISLRWKELKYKIKRMVRNSKRRLVSN